MRLNGIIFASLAAIGIGVALTMHEGGSSEESTVEFEQNVRSKEDCFSWTSEHLSACSSPSCMNLVLARLPKCLDYAKGDKAPFCESVEQQFWGGVDDEFFATHCEPHDSLKYNCEKIVKSTMNYCAAGN